MKQFFFAFAMLMTGLVYGAVSSGIHDTLEKKFMNVFPKAENVKWFRSDSIDEVVFMSGQIDCRIWYKPDGAIIKTVRYYTEESLPPFILARVYAKFPGKKICGVTELTSEDGLKYFINIADEKFLLNIESDPVGKITVVQKIKKAPDGRSL